MLKLKKKTQSGFTLVELLVVITIFVILTGVVLFNQSKFNSTILLTNLAYDTALTIRQAQNYGINIRGFNSEFVPYGVHFDLNHNKSFILYADILYDKADPDSFNSYSGGDLNQCQTDSGCVNRYNIIRGNRISNLCINDVCNKTSLDIVFRRPNPDAFIRANDSISDENKATIILSGADGTTRKVEVQSNGLIQILPKL